jgi:N-acetylmuramoyl-L-alanine amidase-like protein
VCNLAGMPAAAPPAPPPVFLKTKLEVQPRPQARPITPAVSGKAAQIKYLTVGCVGALTYDSAIRRRARKIGDPVARIKYLQFATTPGAQEAFEARRRLTARRRAASLALAFAICFLGTAKPLPHKVIAGWVARPVAPPPVQPPVAAVQPQTVVIPVVATNVWPVEQTGQYDLYSNGLRIENRLAISNHPRSYSLIGLESGVPGPPRSHPAGVVFHMTESYQAPFEPDHTAALSRATQGLLEYVRNKRAYHFVIDRFGRVYRIVAESDSANHAGNSVWADSQGLYVDLNSSFLGVAFEASTQPDAQAKPEPITDPQLHAASLLTAMLRSKYDLDAGNFVTHAQVSVNPGNMRIGWHTDWGSTFPFSELGLPDNYEIPNPALYAFGFEYDQAYINSTGAGIAKGLAIAIERTRRNAAERGMTLAAYKRTLQHRYNTVRSTLQEDRNAGEEEKHKAD